LAKKAAGDSTCQRNDRFHRFLRTPITEGLPGTSVQLSRYFAESSLSVLVELRSLGEVLS
jgi:hypothetical protein